MKFARCAVGFAIALTWVTTSWASVYYKFDLVASHGQTDLSGNALTSISPQSVSINDRGNVAFVGNSAAGSAIYMKRPSSADLPVVSFAPSATRVYANGIRLTNSNQIAAQDRAPGPISLVRFWDGNNPGLFTTVSRGLTAFDTSELAYTANDFDGVFAYPSANQAGQMVFSALGPHAAFKFNGSCTRFCLVTPAAASSGRLFNIRTAPNVVRPAIADDGTVIFRDGNNSDAPVRASTLDLGTVTDLTDDTFIEVGRSPGISNDGAVAVFAGDRGAGRGIFMRLKSGGTWGEPILVAGESSVVCFSPELGYTGAGEPICLKDFDIDAKVAVTHIALGDAGLRDDSIVVSFIGTPSAASRANPQVPGLPMTFSAAKGLWTVRVDLDRPLNGSAGFEAHPASPRPVVQVGDKVQTATGPKVVASIDVVDPLAAASHDDAGAVRTQRRGDHRIAFWFNTAANENYVVRASHLNSSQDGLLDHWKTNGIDIDQDGTPDLDLRALGATVGRRDLFIEIDWTADRTFGVPQPYTHKLLPGVTSALSTMFANAPALAGAMYGVRSDGTAPPAIPAGIVAHIDAGPSTDWTGNALSQNFATAPPGSLQGGDSIPMYSGGPPPDLLYMGKRNSVSLPGLNALSLDEVKSLFFSTRDKGARELAFHYVVIADFYELKPSKEAPFIGTVASVSADGRTITTSSGDVSRIAYNGILFTTGAAAGHLRVVSGSTVSTVSTFVPWTTRPSAGDRFVFLDGSSGVAEADWRGSSFGPYPGNDVLLTLGAFNVVTPTPAGNYLGNPFLMSQTIAHEIGHNFGLRHHGIDHAPNDAANYRSLMSYYWQTKKCSDPAGCIKSYSQAGDAVFADWPNLRLDTFSAEPHLNNSFVLPASGASNKPGREIPWLQHQEITGPFDLQPPTLTIVSPVAGAAVALSQPLVVTVSAADNVGVTGVSVSFDVNGDGILQPSETVSAVAGTGTSWTATFASPVSGTATSRVVRARAVDAAGLIGEAVATVSTGAVAQATVPNVVGQTTTVANAALAAVGLKVGTVTSAPSSTVAVGLVVSQTPAATQRVAVGTSVNLIVSSGPAPVSTPGVVGLTQASAQSALTAAGLKLGTVSLQASTTVASGLVISQNPPASTSVAPGSSVNLVVSSGPAAVLTPGVVGLTQAAAQSALTAAGLKLGTVTLQPSSTVASGLVISQNPPASTSVAPGSSVNLVVSSGPAPVPTPGVVGLTQAAAQSALTAAGLKLGTVTLQPSSTVASGLVISQNPPASTSVAPGSSVNLVVSSGPAPVPTPGVVGLTQAAAQSALTAAGLKLGTVTLQPSSTVASGLVISQNPPASTSVSPGSSVNIVLSSGPLAGDANADGSVTCADVAVVKAAFGARTGQPRFDPRADLTLDGLVDVRDLSFVAQRLPAGTNCP